jgi:hypothetical protein
MEYDTSSDTSFDDVENNEQVSNNDDLLDKISRVPTLITKLTRSKMPYPLYSMIESLEPYRRQNIQRQIETILQHDTMDMSSEDFETFAASAKTHSSKSNPQWIELIFVSQDTSDYHPTHTTRRYHFDSVEIAANALYQWNRKEKDKGYDELKTLKRCIKFVRTEDEVNKHDGMWSNYVIARLHRVVTEIDIENYNFDKNPW